MTKYTLYMFIVNLVFMSAVVASEVNAQYKSVREVQISIYAKKSKIKDVFAEIETKTNFKFSYHKEDLAGLNPVNLEMANVTVAEILTEISREARLQFRQHNNNISISPLSEVRYASTVSQVVIEDIEISGKITDENGEGLPGASIVVKGSAKGTTTDLEGNYKLTVSEQSVLVISFVGYKTIEIMVANRTLIEVQMELDAEQLEEIVVIGYGTQKRKDLTGSYASINSEDFQKAYFTNAEELIANKLPGIQITPSSGKPGAGSSILIRGGSSLNASNDPLIVVDGVPLEGWNSGPGMLSQLNPNDIEGFTVLKDASAAAIYGSRASNGVIIINTKKGSLEKTRINISSNTRVSKLTNHSPVLSADQYRAIVNSVGSVTAPGDANTDWQNEIYQAALTTENNVSVSGAYKSLPYRASVGLLDQDGVLKTGNYKRLTALLNLNPTFFDDHLKVNLNLKGSLEDQKNADEWAIWGARAFDPTQPVRVEDQTYGGYFQYTQYETNPALAITNPVSVLEQQINKSNNKRSVGNLQLDYSLPFLPELHINVNAGYDISKGTSESFAPANYFPANISGGYNNRADPSTEIKNTLFESYLFYSGASKVLKSRFDFTVGYSYNNFLTTNYFYPSYQADGTKFPNSDPAFAFDKPSHSIISFYGRLNYVLNEKYLLTATLRDDGSSRFPEKNRWGLFPSVALAWKINGENFLKNNSSISDLKLRVSHGVTGQQDGIGNYVFIPGYTTGDLNYTYTFGNTSYATVTPSIYNPDLKWEQTASSNVGLDFGIMNNRISGSIDVYRKKTKDLLNNTIIPLGVNFGSSLLLNIGEMENKGVEFALNATPVEKDNFTWGLNFNFTYNQGKITHLSDVSNDGVGLFSSSTLVNTVGYPRNTFYSYHQVYDSNGMPLEGQMLDLNSDGLLNAEDRYVTNKSAAPNYLLGFSTNVQYKKWNLGASWHANIGHYLHYHPYDNTISITGWATSQNLNAMYYETLFSHNDQSQTFSDFYIQNASFLKMDNIMIGYDFGKAFANSKVGLRVNLSVQNVFTITNYTGDDPEAIGGFENSYPIPRVFALGLNLNF